MKQPLRNIGSSCHYSAGRTFSVHGENDEGRFHIWLHPERMNQVHDNKLYRNSHCSFGQPGYFDTRTMKADSAANAGIVAQLLAAAPGVLEELQQAEIDKAGKLARVQTAQHRAGEEFERYRDRALADAIAYSPVAYLTRDPVTGEEIFDLYTEDGRGNGNLIFAVSVADLRAAVLKHAVRQARIMEGLDDGN